MRRKALLMAVLLVVSVWMTACSGGRIASDEEAVTEKPTYMIYYGVVDDRVVQNAKQYDIAILHPRMGNLTRQQVQEIQSAGTLVLGYIAVGEDLRTAYKTPEEMLEDERFTADGTGPRTDPRAEGDVSLQYVSVTGNPSPGGTGYASYYLDDNDHDGRPDINPVFHCAYTNIGDPAWFEVLDTMQMDGDDTVPGMREILTLDYGRGLGCDGLFLDTIDTCAPNNYTTDDNPSKTRFEWTAVGVADFMSRIKTAYPDKLLCQNRGLFFYHPNLAHYAFTPRASVDYLFFESYMLDSNADALYNESFFADNKYSLVPKLMAEASRPDGFTILSLGYAEGPAEYELKSSLLGKSEAGLDILLTDMREAQELAGFSHYITDGGLTLLNDFVLEHSSAADTEPPVWSSVYNHSQEWPPHAPTPRPGISAADPIEGGMIVRWDVALDRHDVVYTLYYQDKPFDFKADPDLTQAQQLRLEPETGEGYTNGISGEVYPYQATVTGLEPGKYWYFVIRAKDTSENHNEEKNTVVLLEKPLSFDL